jgi:hypothetical protein
MAAAWLSREELNELKKVSPKAVRDIQPVLQEQPGATAGGTGDEGDGVIQLEPISIEDGEAPERQLTAEEQVEAAKQARAEEIRQKFAQRGAKVQSPAPVKPEPGPEP